jgi:group I intron endonuclease
MVVYRVTNTTNGKVYIGQTVQSIEVYWKQGHVSPAMNQRGTSRHFYNAIRKYGADAFKVEVLHKAKSLEELSKMETFFIVLHQSHLRENGYNMTLGGEGAMPGELNPMWGKTHSDAVKAKLRALRLGATNSPESNEKRRQAELGEKNPFFGKTHSEQTRKILREKLSGKNHPLFGKKRPPEFGQKVSRALTGIVRSKETRKRISDAKKGQGLGRKHSPEAIERMRAIRSLYWARRKGGEVTVSTS